jgi:hypothetical protein
MEGERGRERERGAIGEWENESENACIFKLRISSEIY